MPNVITGGNLSTINGRDCRIDHSCCVAIGTDANSTEPLELIINFPGVLEFRQVLTVEQWISVASAMRDQSEDELNEEILNSNIANGVRNG